MFQISFEDIDTPYQYKESEKNMPTLKYLRHYDSKEKSYILGHLEKSSYINYIPKNWYYHLDQHVQLKSYPPFASIIEEGKLNNRSYLLIQGDILVFKQDVEDCQMPFSKITQNQKQFMQLKNLSKQLGCLIRKFSDEYILIGQYSSTRGEPATASIISFTNSKLIQFSRDLSKVLNFQIQQEKKSIMEFFKSKLFPMVSLNSQIFLQNTLKYFYFQKYKSDEAIIKEGHPVDKLFYLYQGQIIVSKMVNNIKIKIAVLQKGELLQLRLGQKKFHLSQFTYTANSYIKNIGKLPDKWIKYFKVLQNQLFLRQKQRAELLKKSRQAYQKLAKPLQEKSQFDYFRGLKRDMYFQRLFKQKIRDAPSSTQPMIQIAHSLQKKQVKNYHQVKSRFKRSKAHKTFYNPKTQGETTQHWSVFPARKSTLKLRMKQFQRKIIYLF